MPVSDYFASTYADARRRFLGAARNAGASVNSCIMEGIKGPDGEDLAIDVAWLGPREPTRMLMLIAGTHGIEGFAGSGCLVGYLQDRLYEALPEGSSFVLIHALNPYGFAWLRRVNEDNVDLNRNFLDFGIPPPSAKAYEQVHEWLVPADWDGDGRKSADAAITGFIAKEGMEVFQAAVTGGQYTRPTGLFYGGQQETWSNRMVRTILRERVETSVRRMIVIDLHSGLGPSAYGEPIYLGGGDQGFETAQRQFGPELTRPGKGASAVVTGTLLGAIESMFGNVETTSLALEFGTRPVMEVLGALRGDHWLHAVPNRATALRDSIKAGIRAAFYVETAPWKTAVYGRAADFAMRASRVLGAA